MIIWTIGIKGCVCVCVFVSFCFLRKWNYLPLGKNGYLKWYSLSFPKEWWAYSNISFTLERVWWAKWIQALQGPPYKMAQSWGGWVQAFSCGNLNGDRYDRSSLVFEMLVPEWHGIVEFMGPIGRQIWPTYMWDQLDSSGAWGSKFRPLASKEPAQSTWLGRYNLFKKEFAGTELWQLTQC